MTRLLAIVLGVLLLACGRAPSEVAAANEVAASGSASAAASPSEPLESAAPTASERAPAAPPPGPPVPAWASAPPFSSPETHDIVIAGGTIVDGTGARATPGDVVIDDGRIVHVGAIDPTLKARERIDASGLVVAPGFIDTHAHGDYEGPNRNFLAMGVTTICVGQDGRSPANDRIGVLRRRLERKRLAVNVAPFVGHGTVRQLAKVGASKKPSEAQIGRMAKLVASELDAGAFGLTTGLEYGPGMHAPPEELVALARPVAEAGGVVMSHLRSEDDDRIAAALDELIAQGEKGGARVHVAHVKVVYGKGAERAEQLLAKLADARSRGVRITADIYPYEASYTTIGIVFPAFAKPPHDYRKVKRDKREELATFLRERVALRGGPQATLFGTAPWRGKTLAEVAEAKKKPFEDVLIDDLGPHGASAAFFVMDPELQARLLVDPHVMIASDGGSLSRHPRGFGTFAKVLRQFVVDEKRLTLEEAVRKMTSLPASTVGLGDRGKLAPGAAADVVVFALEAVRDRATYLEPNLLAEGMRWVLVNGRAAIRDGEGTRTRAGELLLRSNEAQRR